jgi:hypothetical protein
VPDTERRWGDKAWDVGMRVIGVLAIAVSGFFYSQITDTQKRIQQLEVKAAVVDEAKNAILVTLGEIKADIREIKAQIKKGP